MFTKAKLEDYKIIETKDGEPKVVLTFKTEDSRVFNYFGSLDKTEKLSKNGKPYSFYGITKSVLQTCGFPDDEEIFSLEDSHLKETSPVLNLHHEFNIELREYTKDGKTYSSVYRVTREKSMGLDRAKELLGGAGKKTGTYSDEDINF